MKKTDKVTTAVKLVIIMYFTVLLVAAASLVCSVFFWTLGV